MDDLGSRLGGLLLALTVTAAAAPEPASAQNVVHLESCYDGDTCRFVEFERSVRFARIDTPEMHGACGEAARRARAATLRKLRSADRIEVHAIELGKYGRIIGEVRAEGENVNDWLIQRGYAVAYGKRTCDRPQGPPRQSDSQRPPRQDMDCGDFNTHSAAQRFYERAGGPQRDPHRLDGDHDGRACETL